MFIGFSFKFRTAAREVLLTADALLKLKVLSILNLNEKRHERHQY